jgi:MoaA/NifB/PqqE/SkfB family radical SAM enzyme
MAVNDSKVFCIVPWTHMYLQQDGRAFPCCNADPALPIGDMRRSSLREIWDGAAYRALRLRMLRGERSDACVRCYDLEAAGARSQRVHLNRKYAHHLPIVDTTRPDGGVPALNMPLVDIRYSNVCNFKCRTCGPQASSSWAADAMALRPGTDLAAIVRPHDDPEWLWDQVRDVLARAQEISFAGGEPLMMDEHYRVLDLLIEKGRTDVEMHVFTNLSRLEHKGRSVLPLWRFFRKLHVHASLDAAGPRGELLRHGLVWADVLENIRRLRDGCPRIRFAVAATVSVMNVMHLPELHRALVAARAIRVDEFELHNIVTAPEELRIQILPAAMKRAVERLYREHLDWLTRVHRVRARARVRAGFETVLRFMNLEDRSALLPRFLDYTAALDRLRGEAFFDVFPELAPLRPSP